MMGFIYLAMTLPLILSAFLWVVGLSGFDPDWDGLGYTAPALVHGDVCFAHTFAG